MALVRATPVSLDGLAVAGRLLIETDGTRWHVQSDNLEIRRAGMLVAASGSLGARAPEDAGRVDAHIALTEADAVMLASLLGARTSSAFGIDAGRLTAGRITTGAFELHGPLYVPSAGEAWNSLQVLNHSVSLGWFIRALHGWGANFMVAIVLVHMTQVFLFGAFKFPRELTWILGVFLLLATLGMAFTGEVMRFDQDAYWGLGIGASMVSRVPVLGPWLVNLLLGGPIIAGPTLSRFFVRFVIPGSLTPSSACVLLVKLGVNESPTQGQIVAEKYLS
jgi:hypothetical protein